MKKTIFLIFAVLLCSTVTAQDTVGPTFAPIDLFTCNFNKGKGQADLDKVVEKWNAWMDESESEPYSAWLLTPDYNSPEYPFDVAWLGAWQNGKSMGISHDHWLANGGAVAKEFAKVMSCSTHLNMASMNLKAGVSENSDSAVLGFTDCSVKEGSSLQAASQAMGEWFNYSAEQGSVASAWLFFPAFGPDASFDFKRVTAHPNYAEWGLDFDRYGTGGGFAKASELLDDKVSCGGTRVYQADRVRDATPDS